MVETINVNGQAYDEASMWPVGNARRLVEIGSDDSCDDLDSLLAWPTKIWTELALTAAKAISPMRRMMDTMREMTGILAERFLYCSGCPVTSVDLDEQSVSAG